MQFVRQKPDILNLEILKKKFHPWDAPYGGMFLEVKNPKNRIPKVIFHPIRIFKNHQFVVMFLTLKTADKGKCPNAPNVSSRLWNIKKKFTPGTCLIWGHVFGSEKSKKSDLQSHFTSNQDFQKSSICSNVRNFEDRG